MFNQLKEIRCLNKIDGDFYCGHWLGDMECYPHKKVYLCRRCKIGWEVEQTEDGNMKYKKVKLNSEKKEYDDFGVIMVEE